MVEDSSDIRIAKPAGHTLKIRIPNEWRIFSDNIASNKATEFSSGIIAIL